MKNKISPEKLAKLLFEFFDESPTDLMDRFNEQLAECAKAHCPQGNIGKSAFLYLAISHINSATIDQLENELADAQMKRTLTSDVDSREELADEISTTKILLKAHKKSDKISLENYRDIESSIPIA